MADLNDASEEIFPNAVVETGLNEVRRRAPWPELEGEKKKMGADGKAAAGPETVRFQGLRVGYFCVDSDPDAEGRVVLNRIVSLKEDAGKA